MFWDEPGGGGGCVVGLGRCGRSVEEEDGETREAVR